MSAYYSVASKLNKQQCISNWDNTRGWIETPDGKFYQPDPNKIKFINGLNQPYMDIEKKPRWFARLMGIFF